MCRTDVHHLLALEEREVFCAPERYDALEPRFLASRVQLMGQISGASIYLVPALDHLYSPSYSYPIPVTSRRMLEPAANSCRPWI